MEEHNIPDHPAFRTKHPSENLYKFMGYELGTFELVIIILAVFTAIEISISMLLERGALPFLIAVVLLVFFALVKATLVGGFFMHIFYEKKPFTIFMIAFGFPMLIITPVALVALTI